MILIISCVDKGKNSWNITLKKYLETLTSLTSLNELITGTVHSINC